jgi:hypothetical protein
VQLKHREARIEERAPEIEAAEARVNVLLERAPTAAAAAAAGTRRSGYSTAFLRRLSPPRGGGTAKSGSSPYTIKLGLQLCLADKKRNLGFKDIIYLAQGNYIAGCTHSSSSGQTLRLRKAMPCTRQ